jgi:2-oxoglutarate dehydrogenase E2 component (dihydrolipoamide succinyltransferase)
MADIKVPKLNSNDEQYILTEWLAADGADVRIGDPIAIIETSKAANELTCQWSGILQRCLPDMTVCRQGDIIARISAGSQCAQAADQGAPDGDDEGKPDLAIAVTDSARDLMLEHGLSIADVAKPNMRLIRLAHVRSVLDQDEGSSDQQGLELSRHQLAVAQVVSRSHSTIPSAFLALKALATWIPSSGQASASVRPGIPERVIGAVAASASSFPLMFAHVSDDLRLGTATSVDVGVTIDVGGGLVIPVIRRADQMSAAEISAALMALRVQARRNRLDDAQLAGARIIVALQQEPGVIVSMPIVYPGTVCTVSVGALDWEVVLGDTGPRQQAWFTLGIAYDHRVVNGREVAAFLTEVREYLGNHGGASDLDQSGPTGGAA